MNEKSVPAAGVPVDVSRTLVRLAALFEELFGPHDVLDAAYVADTLRAAAGVDPMHQGAAAERLAALEVRRQMALGLLESVERLTAGGYTARVRILHDEVEVSALEVHEAVAQAVDQVRGGPCGYCDGDGEHHQQRGQYTDCAACGGTGKTLEGMSAARRELLDAVEARDKLFEEIRAKGTPPHSDYWHQSIAEAEARIARARAAI